MRPVAHPRAHGGCLVTPRWPGVLGALAAAFAMLSAPVAALEHTVDTNPYMVNHTLLAGELWNAYELTAANGQQVAYWMNVSTAGTCASFLFVRGHDVTLESTYYLDYSQENCTRRYSNSFPVESGDGTAFTILITRAQPVNVSYNLTVSVVTPAPLGFAPGLLGFLAFVAVGSALGGLIGILIDRRKVRRRAPEAPPTGPVGPQEPA